MYGQWYMYNSLSTTVLDDTMNILGMYLLLSDVDVVIFCQ